MKSTDVRGILTGVSHLWLNKTTASQEVATRGVEEFSRTITKGICDAPKNQGQKIGHLMGSRLNVEPRYSVRQPSRKTANHYYYHYYQTGFTGSVYGRTGNITMTSFLRRRMTEKISGQNFCCDIDVICGSGTVSDGQSGRPFKPK